MAALMGIGVLTVLLRPEPQPPVLADTQELEQRVERYLLTSAHLPDWWQRLGAWFVGAVVCPFVDFIARNGRNALSLLLLVGASAQRGSHSQRKKNDRSSLGAPSSFH